jgi:CRP-like cAMP-binding protein
MFKASSEFARASDEAKSALLAALTRRTYANNEVVYLQEDEAQQLYFVVSGHIRLSYVMDDGSAILYAILPPGDTSASSASSTAVSIATWPWESEMP